MNHRRPAQRQKDGRWDYTMQNDRDKQPHPIGYCSGFRPYTSKNAAWLSAEQRAIENERLERQRDKYHIDGHATEEEARQCYRTYLLDNCLRFITPPSNPPTLHRCQAPGCGEMTAGAATISTLLNHWYLCDAHRNRETVEILFPTVHDSVGTV